MSETETRQSGKRGRKPARHVPELHIARYRLDKGDRGPAPPAGDVSNGITDWGMLGNDRYSCCGASAWVHYLMAKAGTNTVTFPAGDGKVYQADDPALTDAMLAVYFGYGRSQGETGDQPDEGVENATWLRYLFDQGLIEAFAEVDLTNPDEARWDMLDFGGLLVGLALSDQAETEFEQQTPWDISSTEPIDPNLGHDTLFFAYDADGETTATWGKGQRCTIRFAQAEIQAHDGEAWVIITREDAARANIDIDALRAEIQRLGGTLSPDAPAPGGTPPPAPAPDSPQPEPAPVDPNSPRGQASGAVYPPEHWMARRVEAIFDRAKAEAHAALDRAKAEAHALVVDMTGAPPVEGS